MRWDFVTLGLFGVGCSLTSMDSLDDNLGATGYAGAAGVTGTGGGSNACVPSCERATQAGCQSFTMDSCLAECQAKGASIPGACVSAYGSLLLCATSGSYICDTNGKPALVTCNAEAAELASCTGASDAGPVDAGVCDPGAYLGATCDQVNAGSPNCTQCIDQFCCVEVDTCFAANDCAGLYACSAECYMAPDFSQCVYDTCPACTTATNSYNAISQCLSDNCSAACSGP